MDKTATLSHVEGAVLRGKAYTEAACAAITKAVAKEMGKRPTQEQVEEAINAGISSVSGPTGAAAILHATIPRGRMRGDLNGDGILSWLDGTAIERHMGQWPGYILTDEIDLWCADADGDGTVNPRDVIFLQRYLLGMEGYKEKIAWADYYGNWSFDLTTDLWSTQLTVPGMNAEMSAAVLVHGAWDGGMLVAAQIQDGTLQITANRPPIAALPCEIIFGPGDGGAVILFQNTENVTMEEVAAATKPAGWAAFAAGEEAPEDQTQLWIDTGGGGLKYWNGTEWTAVPAAAVDAG